MIKWEYKKHQINYFADDPDFVENRLNEFGAQGWELIHAPSSGHSATYIFKRPIETFNSDYKENVIPMRKAVR